jgi:hypothetical protein
MRYNPGNYSPVAESTAEKSTDRHRWTQIKSKHDNICENLAASVDFREQAEQLLIRYRPCLPA